MRVAYVNCMSMWSVTHVYAAVLQSLFGVGVRRGTALRRLEEELRTGKGGDTKVIILDEVGQFVRD